MIFMLTFVEAKNLTGPTKGEDFLIPRSHSYDSKKYAILTYEIVIPKSSGACSHYKQNPGPYLVLCISDLDKDVRSNGQLYFTFEPYNFHNFTNAGMVQYKILYNYKYSILKLIILESCYLVILHTWD